MDLDSVVDELYGLDPADFTARRDALAGEARKGGDRDLATAIKALKKPSAAAFTVNLMARTHAEEIDRLIALGGRLREAQAALSGDDLRALGRQRQQLVAGVAQEARRTAREAGQPVSDAVQREVESTFEAALADEAAGEAVKQGRLLRSLERSGMDPVDRERAVAGGPPAPGRPGPGKVAATRPTPTANDDGDELARARRARDEKTREERARAEEEAARADREAREAEERLAAAVSQLEEAERQRDAAEEAVNRLQEQLAEARDRADRAASEEHRARRVRRDAEDEADHARAAAERARRRADALGG